MPGVRSLSVSNDKAIAPVPDSPLKALPLAKSNLVDANVVAESRKLLGQIANVYYRLGETLVMIYEVHSSIFDKLLGHAPFFLASHQQLITIQHRN